jgi:hypothetical protein
MGLFDKLFGGDKQPDPAAPQQPSTSTPTPMPSGTSSPGPAVPPRRERSKPSAMPAATSAPLPEQASFSADAISFPADADNAALLNAIGEVVQHDTPETRAGLYAAVLQSMLYLVSMPGEGDAELGTGEITLQEGQQLSLATIRDGEGRTYLPAFTDLERLSRSLPEKARYVRIAAQSVCRMFMQGDGEGIVINPAQAPTGVITRAEAQALANGVAPEIDENGQLRIEVPQQMRIAVGKPDVAPAESFVEAIRGEAAKHSIVREVHLFKAAIEDQQPRLMIGLLVDEGLTPEQMHPAFETIGKAAYEARGDSEAFDMMPLNEQMIEAIRPIEGIVYSRDQEV